MPAPSRRPITYRAATEFGLVRSAFHRGRHGGGRTMSEDLNTLRRLEAEITKRMFLLLEAADKDHAREQMVQFIAHSATRSAWQAAKYGPNEAYARLASDLYP